MVFFIGKANRWTLSYMPKAKLPPQVISLFHLNKDINLAFLLKTLIPRTRKKKNYLPVTVQEE